MMLSRSLFLVALSASIAMNFENANGQTSRFDFGSTDGNDLHQTGWTIFELSNGGASQPTSPADPNTGWTITLDPSAAGRDRDPFDATTGGTFSLDDVYLDFIVSWEFLTINNLNPAATYDVQLIMFDDNNSGDGRRQTVFNVTDGANDFLGTSDGPGIGGSNASLTSDLDFSVFGTGLSPDGAGDLTFRFSNTATGNRSLVNGVVITQVIPEPASIALLGLGGLMICHRRKR